MDAFGILPGLGSAAYGVDLPVGAVIAFAGDPTVAEWPAQNPNWLPCDGTPRQIADYPELYYALGSGKIYGSDTTMFTLPNYAAMFLRGVAANGTGLNQDPGERTAPRPTASVRRRPTWCRSTSTTTSPSKRPLKASPGPMPRAFRSFRRHRRRRRRRCR
jgi:hypothetical protein